MKYSTTILMGMTLLLMASCVNLTRYKSPGFQDRPLKTRIKRVVLYERFIKSDKDTLRFKKQFFTALKNHIRTKDGYDVIVIKSNDPLPDLRNEEGVLWVSGNLWSEKTVQSGESSQIKKLSKRTKTYSRRWDVLEHIRWKKDSYLLFSNLYFIEVSSKPKILRSSFTASHIEFLNRTGTEGTSHHSTNERFEFSDPDKRAQSYWGDSTAKRLAMGYHTVSIKPDKENMKASLKTLAEMAVERHLKFPSKP